METEGQMGSHDHAAGDKRAGSPAIPGGDDEAGWIGEIHKASLKDEYGGRRKSGGSPRLRCICVFMRLRRQALLQQLQR